MRDVAAFARLAHAVALDRLGEDDRRRAAVLHRRLVGRVDLQRIVAAAAERDQLLVGQVFDHRLQPRIDAEEMLADVGAGHDRVLLQLAVDDLAHAADQQAVGVLGQQRVPVGAPQDLDHVPAGAAEGAFQLLHDLAVAADRAVQPLQVAVDDEDQVVEALAGGQGDRAQRFRLVALAVAEEGPDPRGLGVGLDAAIDQVVVEAGLIDGHDRPQAHRHRGELPEVGHEPGVRIGRQPAAGLQLAAEVHQVLLGQAAQEKRPGVDSRRGMPLEEDLVGRLRALLAAEEVVEGHFVQRGGRGEGGDMPADAAAELVGADDHRHGVPADDALDAAFDLAVAGVCGLEFDRNGVDIRRGGAGGEGHADAEGPFAEFFQQELCPFPPLGLADEVERLQPFRRFLGIVIPLQDGHDAREQFFFVSVWFHIFSV